MRANHHSLQILALAGASLLASCTAIPSSAPPTPAPQATPATPAPATPAPVPQSSNWRDAPITPGDWTWGMEGNRSVARFANGVLALSCDPTARTVTLLRQGTGRGAVPVTIRVVDSAHSMNGTPVAGPPPAIAVTFRATDSTLDAMAFSRGRFAVETAGLPTLYVPSWPEVSRVIEDCR